MKDRWNMDGIQILIFRYRSHENLPGSRIDTSLWSHQSSVDHRTHRSSRAKSSPERMTGQTVFLLIRFVALVSFCKKDLTEANKGNKDEKIPGPVCGTSVNVQFFWFLDDSCANQLFGGRVHMNPIATFVT